MSDSPRKPLASFYAKKNAYIGDIEFDARFCLMGFREFGTTNASSSAAQLQNTRLSLTVISYRMWNFRNMDVSRSFLKSRPLERGISAKPPHGAQKNSNTTWKLAKPLYGLATSCRGWSLTLRDPKLLN